MKRYALIGHPLGHSLSPEIHRRLFALEGLDADYALLDIPPEELASRADTLRELAAFNVTIPHKRAVIPLLDSLGDAARLFGAVNAVHNADGRLVGDNTDCGGFLRALGAHGVAIARDICVLGAGGVGRMFALECARQGARVTVAVRESGRERASELAREAQEKLGAELSVRGIDALDGRFSLLINGTPVGMYPNTDACPVPPALLDGVDTVFDCVYNPSETLLLRHARERGVKAVGGMEMLVWQAAIAHEIWHGTRFSDRAVGRIVEEMAAYLLLKEQTP